MSVACRPFFFSLSPIDLSWLDAQNVCDVLFEFRYTNIDDLWQVRFAASGRGGGGLLRVHWTLPAQSAGPAIVGSLLHEAVPQRTSRRSPYAIRQKVKCHNNKTNKHKHTHTHTHFGRISPPTALPICVDANLRVFWLLLLLGWPNGPRCLFKISNIFLILWRFF